MINAGSIARRYAKALLSIGVEGKTFEQLGKELDQFAELFTNHEDLVQVLINPTHAQSKRKAVMEELISRMRPSATVRGFLLLLVDRNRVGIVADVAREYKTMVDEHVGQVRASVTSARALKPDEVAKLQKALADLTKKKVILSQKTDDQLIAGTVTQIGSVLFDGSVRTRLQDMRDGLLEGR